MINNYNVTKTNYHVISYIKNLGDIEVGLSKGRFRRRLEAQRGDGIDSTRADQVYMIKVHVCK